MGSPNYNDIIVSTETVTNPAAENFSSAGELAIAAAIEADNREFDLSQFDQGNPDQLGAQASAGGDHQEKAQASAGGSEGTSSPLSNPNEQRFVLIKTRDEFDKSHFVNNADEEDEEGQYVDPFGEIEDAPWDIENSKSDLESVLSKTPSYLHGKLSEVYEEFKGVFKTEVDAKPAKLEAFQLPLARNSRKYTAFATVFGIFEWLRVPMGLKGAASHFQRLDDVILYAETEDELQERLREVLKRFEKFNIKAHPEKIQFGLTEIEYVGRLLSKDGTRITDINKETVLEIKRPLNQKQLKPFLGMTGYLRAYIPNYSRFERPLADLCIPYKQRNIVSWTPAAIQAFEEMKNAVLHAQMLFFYDDNLPNSEIILRTDASNVGAGGVLAQRYTTPTGETLERPIKLYSRAFRGAEKRWATNEQEAFAIYFAIKKWRHLLLDRKFTIETDHANLAYISEKTSPKVLRWRLAIDEFDFKLRHIPGETNTEADAASRLCLAVHQNGNPYPSEHGCSCFIGIKEETNPPLLSCATILAMTTRAQKAMLKTTARAPFDTGVQDVSTDDIFGDEEIPSSLIHQTQQIDPFICDLFQQSHN